MKKSRIDKKEVEKWINEVKNETNKETS